MSHREHPQSTALGVRRRQYRKFARDNMGNVSLGEMKARQSPEIRKRVKVRAAELRTELATLREIREKIDMTQVELAAMLDIGQEGVSRLERRNDILVSTLRKVVEAMGGDLRLIAELPDGERVELSGIGDA